MEELDTSPPLVKATPLNTPSRPLRRRARRHKMKKRSTPTRLEHPHPPAARMGERSAFQTDTGLANLDTGVAIAIRTMQRCLKSAPFKSKRTHPRTIFQFPFARRPDVTKAPRALTARAFSMSARIGGRPRRARAASSSFHAADRGAPMTPNPRSPPAQPSTCGCAPPGRDTTSAGR